MTTVEPPLAEFGAPEPIVSCAVPLFVAVSRIVPEIERSGDLVEHFAARTPQGMDLCVVSA